MSRRQKLGLKLMYKIDTIYNEFVHELGAEHLVAFEVFPGLVRIMYKFFNEKRLH